MKASTRLNSRGFTIIELMISTTVFSLILLLCMTAILFVARQYYKGVTLSKTQEVSRQIVASMTDAVKFNRERVRTITAPIGSGWTGAVCIGNRKYSYKLDTVLEKAPDTSKRQSSEVFVETLDSVCSSALPVDGGVGAPPKKELMGEHMRLNSISITDPNNDGLATLQLSVVYGGDGTDADDAVLYEKNGNVITNCKSGSNSHFCTVSNVTKTIYGAQ